MSLPEAVEVEPPRGGQLRRLALALLGAGLLIGVVAGLGSAFLGTWSQTEAGLCRVTWAPCSELSLASVRQLSGLDLPEGTEVISGYAQELGTLHQFRSEIVLPEGETVVMWDAYVQGDELLDLPDAARGLQDVTIWMRPTAVDGYAYAVLGQRDGRTVVVFDEDYVPAS